MERIVVRINTTELAMTTRDTPTAEAILKKLPLQAVAQTWGEEVYFRVPVSAALEDDARDIVEKGDYVDMVVMAISASNQLFGQRLITECLYITAGREQPNQDPTARS